MNVVLPAILIDAVHQFLPLKRSRVWITSASACLQSAAVGGLARSAVNARPPPVTIGVIERSADLTPASGLGLLLQETKELLRELQTNVVAKQAPQFVSAASKCRSCSKTLGVKDRNKLVYRTAFVGVERSISPRLYSRCACCGTMAGRAKTISPLAQALPERTPPQWTWLQCRYASVMSFHLAQKFLRDAFPTGQGLAVSSLKVNLRAVGSRLDRLRLVFSASPRC